MQHQVFAQELNKYRQIRFRKEDVPEKEQLVAHQLIVPFHADAFPIVLRGHHNLFHTKNQHKQQLEENY